MSHYSESSQKNFFSWFSSGEDVHIGNLMKKKFIQFSEYLFSTKTVLEFKELNFQFWKHLKQQKHSSESSNSRNYDLQYCTKKWLIQILKNLNTLRLLKHCRKLYQICKLENDRLIHLKHFVHQIVNWKCFEI